MQNLHVEKKPAAKTPIQNPIVDLEGSRAIFVFSRSWSRAVASQSKKPTSARSLGRS